MNNKLEVIGIDHGWSMMKTISQVFVTGVKEITTTPALFGDVLEYEGKFYKVGTVRQMLLRQEKHRRQSRKRQGRSCQKSGKIKPDKFRGVGVKSCVLFICLKQFMIWRMFQEITRMD